MSSGSGLPTTSGCAFASSCQSAYTSGTISGGASSLISSSLRSAEAFSSSASGSAFSGSGTTASFCDSSSVSVPAGTVSSAGYQTGLYASEGYCRFNLNYEAVAQFPLWLASYTVDNRLPQYIDGYAMWQQTDSAYAGGIDGPFDLDLILR